jgi:hypothetical protein
LQAALPGENLFLRGTRLSILNQAQIDPDLLTNRHSAASETKRYFRESAEGRHFD